MHEQAVMRRKEYAMEAAQARALLARAPHVVVATPREVGPPLVRVMHAALWEDHLVMHGAPAGEKQVWGDQPVTLQAQEVLADIPSTFTHPERACPATTLYLSAQVEGVLRRVEDLDARAAALQALMARFQPQGGYVPITASDRRYRAAVRGLEVWALPLEGVRGKAKLGQSWPDARFAKIIEALWRRGAPGDARAVALACEASDAARWPSWLRGPRGLLICPHLDEMASDEAAAMVATGYWNVGVPVEDIRRAWAGSTVRVGARDPETGALVACARALSDGARRATIFDVFVEETLRGQGVGCALMGLLLDHPALRSVAQVMLGTRDAQRFYGGHGFSEVVRIQRSRYEVSWMERVR